MEKLVNLIRTAENFASLGGAKLSHIEQAERKLGIIFSDDYKEYVLEFGVATFDSRELTGICKSDRLNVVSVTEQARAFYSQLPPNMYVVEELQFDHVLILQDSSGTVYSYGPDEKSKRVSSSLQEYLFPDSKTAD